MSFGGGLGSSQGAIKYMLMVDDAQATTKLNTFKGTLTSLGPATQTVNRNLGALSNNFKGVSGGLTQQNTLMNQSITQHRTMGQSIQQSMGRFSGLATGMSATAASALTLTAGFRDYGDAQIAVDRATRKLSLAQEAQQKAQTKLNELTSKGITSGAEYEQAQLDVAQANQMLEIQTQLVGEAQERMFDSQTQFVVSIVPTVLGAVGTMGAAFKDFGGTLGKVKDVFSGLTSGAGGLGGLTSLIGPLALAVGPLVVGLIAWNDAQKKVNDLTAEMAKARNIENVTERVTAMNVQFDKMKEPFDSPVLNTFAKIGGATTIIEKFTPAVKEANKEIQNNTTVTGALKTKLDEYIAAEKAYHEALKTRQVTDDAAAKATMDNAAAQLIAVDSVKRNVKSTDDLSEAVEIYNGIAKDGISIQEEFNKKFAETSPEIDTLRESFEFQSDALGDMFDNDVWIDPWKRMREQVKAAGIDIKTTGKDYSDYMILLNNGFSTIKKLATVSDTVFTDVELAAMGIKSVIGPDVMRVLGAWSSEMTDIMNITNAVTQNAQQKMPEFRNAQISALEQVRAQIAKTIEVWKTFVTEFNNAEELTGALKIKVDTPDEIAKDILNNLPNKLEKKIKLDLEIEQNDRNTKDAVQMYLSGIIEAIEDNPGEFVWDADLKVDDKKAQEYAEALIEEIDDNTQDEDLKNLEKQLKEAIDRGATSSEILAILSGYMESVPAVKVALDKPTLDALAKTLETAIMQATNNGLKRGFEMDEADWEALGLGEGPDYPGDTTFSDELSKLTPKQIDELKRRGMLPGSTGGDVNLDTDYNRNYTKPGTAYDNPPSFVDKNGNKWIIDPFTGHPYMVKRGDVFNRNISPPHDPAIARLNPLSPISLGMGSTQPGGTLNQKFGSFNISDLQRTGIGGATPGNALLNANPLDIFARQLVQITKNMNTFARTVVQVSNNFNTFARTVVQTTTNFNTYARATVTVTKDHNTLARTQTQITRNNNTLARTIDQITSNNNSYAQTVVQITKNHNTLAKTQVQLTKNNNTLARTIVQVGEDFENAEDSANGFADALADVAAAAKKAAAAIKSIPKNPNVATAQGGMHAQLEQDTLIIAHKGEKVDIGPGAGGLSSGGGGAGGGGIVNQTLNLTISGSELINETKLTKRVKMVIGENRDRFGS